ncbi:MAG: helix-turn-helix domain-containing protein [Nitrospiraceae bacterium]|nr:helix-turn-helix domain-containing protein [Nitrospiraceae bacterium]
METEGLLDSPFFMNSKSVACRGEVVAGAGREDLEFWKSLILKDELVDVCQLKDLPSAITGKRKVDAAVLDCGPDAPAGLKILAEIKTARPEVPVIFIAPDGAPETTLKALKAGARLSFARPVDVLSMKDVLKEFLKAKRATREVRRRFIPADQDAAGPLAATSEKPAALLRVMQYVDDNISEKISLDTLAGVANMSKYHFCRFFLRHAGMSPIRYVVRMRIEKAKDILKASGRTVSSVADQTGFNDLGTFIRQFKNATGLTPSAYQGGSISARPIVHGQDLVD